MRFNQLIFYLYVLFNQRGDKTDKVGIHSFQPLIADTHKIKKVVLIVTALLAVAGGIGAAVSLTASRNIEAMNKTVNTGLDILRSHYTVTACENNEYTDIALNGLIKFHTDQYRVEKLGNLSVMTTNMGAMQMVSFVLTPFEKKMPLLTLDFMYMGNKRKSYVEFYDLVTDPSTDEYMNIIASLHELEEQYKDIADIPMSDNWYDSYLNVVMHKSLTDDDINSWLFCNALEKYLSLSESLDINTEEECAEQLEVIETYTDGLIDQGGVSTDVFKKYLGTDTTRDFFNKVFFGTDSYRRKEG